MEAETGRDEALGVDGRLSQPGWPPSYEGLCSWEDLASWLVCLSVTRVRVSW